MLVFISAVFPTGYEPDETVCSPPDQGQNLMPYLFTVNGLMLLYLPFFMYFYKCDYKRKRSSEEPETAEPESDSSEKSDF